MRRIKSAIVWLGKHPVFIISLFFFIYLIIGLIFYKDYGLGCDELIQRYWGKEYYDLITRKDPLEMVQKIAIYYGPFFQIILAFLEHLFHFQDDRQVFLAFHAFTFLYYFLGVVVLFFLARKLFKNWKYGLLASTILILSPRIFGESFYNPKDIPMLVIFILSSYSLVQFFEKRSILMAFIHGAMSAAAIATRVIGIMIPAITLVVIVLDLLFQSSREIIRTILLMLIYFGITLGFTVLFWPVVYFDLRVIWDAIRVMSSFPDLAWVILYRGQLYHCDELYRNYLPTWIGITTPLPYILLFMIGFMATCFRLLKGLFQSDWVKKHLGDLLVFGWFVVPVAFVMIRRPCLYNGWRHFYFIYPAFVLIAVRGVQFLISSIGKIKGSSERSRKIITGVFLLLLVLSFLEPILFIANNHPYEFLYFNRFAGRDLEQIMANYEMDYWGLAYRDALEYIVKTDQSPLLKIVDNDTRIRYDSIMLKMEDRERIQFCNPNEEPNYVVVYGNTPPQGYIGLVQYYVIKVRNEPLMTVFKIPY